MLRGEQTGEAAGTSISSPYGASNVLQAPMVPPYCVVLVLAPHQVVYLADEGADLTAPLAAVFSALAPGGEVSVLSSSSDSSSVKMALLLAGLVDVAAAASGEGQGMSAKKPQWEVGAAAAVSVKAAPVGVTTWKLDAGDVADDELVDEDALLDDGLLTAAKKPAAPSSDSNDDCGPGGAGTKKRACKNCTCGRAEQEASGAAPVMTDEELKASVSSCGNCYKGDAFRCSGCPFLGLPAFEPGQEKVMLKVAQDA